MVEKRNSTKHVKFISRKKCT